MSLQVWLPLNGDLSNQGLFDTLVTNNGATIDDSGKIGKCYSFNGTSSYITLNSLNCAGWAEFSLSCWCYPTADFTALFLIRGASAHRVRVNADGFTFRDSNNSSQRTIGFGATIPLNTWSYITCVYNRGEVFMYVNGVQTNHSTTYYHTDSQFLSDHNETRIGRQQSSSTNVYYSGKVNDFRIYDHALSVKEVEELSRGLMLHYKLSGQKDYMPPNIPENLFIGTGFSQRDVDNFVANSSTDWTKYFRYYNGNASIHSFENGVDNIRLSSTSNIGIAFLRSAADINLDSTSYYTISCEAKCTSISKNFCIGLSYYKNDNSWVWRGGSNGQAFNAADTWQTFTLTFKPDANTLYICYCFTVATGGNNTLSIRNCKLEKGSTATAWCLNPEDEGYMQSIVSQTGSWTQEYDVSGYGNHAALAGTIAASSDSARYNASTVFDGSSCIKNTNFNLPGKIWTVSCWYYKPTNPTAYEGIFSISKGNGADANKKIAAMPNAGRIWYKGESGSLSISQIGIDKWTFLTMTCNGTTVTVYQDGVNIGTFAASTEMTDCHDLVIGARSNAAGATATAVYYTGEISDFRVYATALSAAAVQELYHTSTTIDRDKNIHAREIIENEDKISITRTGLFKSDTFEENSDNIVSLSRTNIVEGGQIYEY